MKRTLTTAERKCLRMTVEAWTDTEITGTYTVVDSELPRQWLTRGTELNLLLSEQDDSGRLHPQHIVLDPDYLVDVTAICRCATECGDAPAHHLLHKFLPHLATAPIQLGAVANQFLDDLANAPSPTPPDLYRQSLNKCFAADPLRFSTVEGIDGTFSANCRLHFEHIRQTLGAHPVSDARLETAFLCQALGIQGRMDLMSGDRRTIVELKSGKGGFTGTPGLVAYRYEHALQMALYKESLYYNAGLPYAQVQTLLFYSLYPALLDIHLGRQDIHRALTLRNGIVALEHRLASEPARLLQELREEDFNPAGRQDRFYLNYRRPEILRLLSALQRSDDLLQAYFRSMLAFVEREQQLAKTGREGIDLPPGKHGFADVWRNTAEQRTEAGDLIDNLRLTPDDLETDDSGALLRLHLRAPHTADSNFRPGDMVMLHPSGHVAFYFPCIVEETDTERVVLRLRYPQRDASALDLTRSFAIEPAHADSTFSVIYQGLFALLEAPRRRQDLLLGRRPPQTDTARRLTCPIDDAELRDIVLRAKQAEDYFLLVGPPGTGKTSVALRQMVIEFLASQHAAGHTRPDTPLHPDPDMPPQNNLLLMAFTNRAVDEICQMLTTIDPRPEYVRIGPETSADAAFRQQTLSARTRQCPTRAGIRQLLCHTRIIVGTIASLSSSQELFLLKQFSTAIVDEASQVLEPQMLPLLCAQSAGRPAISKFIFIGDHKQLPAVVAQSPDYSATLDPALHQIGLTDCRRSLFERLHEHCLARGYGSVVAMLHRQGRMHRDICRFASREYYASLLDIVPLPHQTETLVYASYDATLPLHDSLARQRLLCFDVPDGNPHGQKSNAQEATLAARIVEATNALCRRNGLPRDWHHRLGIIVPFRAQIMQLRAALVKAGVPEAEDITIDTVERYQGSQRDIILFTTVVGAAWQLPILSAPVESEGMMVDRKLNVALTRARKQFILIGDLTLLASCRPYKALIQYIQGGQATRN